MRHQKIHSQRGFTLHEMLLVILISVVLLAVSVVGIITYMRHLQLAQMDNSAKEIFLAAQNRAILLSGSQQLKGLVIREDNKLENVDVIPNSTDTVQITAYYIHSDDPSIEELLPRETIDPTLWEGDFYITYEPESGSVVDVFFSEGTLQTEGNFSTFYQTWRAAAKSARMGQNPMIGYYGGESAESGNTISLRTPVINIYNEDTLRAEVTYWVPQTLVIMGENVYVNLDVTLTYEGREIPLDKFNAADQQETADVSYRAYTYTWILDSLKDEETQFRELVSTPGTAEPVYGQDFTLTAAVSYEGGRLQVNGAKKSATDNSLFAKGSVKDTAYIAYLRHLQNLDTEWSGVSGKTAAMQIRDVQKVEDYSFRPVENDELESYDGQEYSIYDLMVEADGSVPAGLFGTFSGQPSDYKDLEDIRLVNTKVIGSGGPAGALVGSGTYLTFTNCQVYWENRSQEATNLREVLGDSAAGIRYQITNTGTAPAGGLAGQLRASVITGSSASTLVESSGPAGGLVGEGSGLTIQKSYAASYLSGPAAAGLVGNLTGSAGISASYAVGFIDTDPPGRAAGLCLGSGNADVTSSYSAMLFTAGEGVTNYPLCEKSGDYPQTHFLDSKQFNFVGGEGLGVSYADLTDPGKWNELFGSGVFTSKTVVQSHPYNLQTTLSLNTFIYPGLADLDHWGDWAAQFQNGSLVYYEIYDDGSYGFDGGGVSHLAESGLVREDGYAVAYRSTEEISYIGGKLEVTYQGTEGETEGTYAYGDAEGDPIYKVENVTDSDGVAGDYFLLPLPDEVVNTGYAAPDFYQKITILDTENHTEKSYYYNPHFANTVLRQEDVASEEELAETADQLAVEVRSPRHLYMLSQFGQYYASAHQYRFLQRLDLDYRVYTGYELFGDGWSQTPIGLSADSPFRCSYYGDSHIITGVTPAAEAEDRSRYQYVGLFGYSTGVLRNVVYQMQEDQTLFISQSGSSSDTLYAGALAGYNGGAVENCAAFGIRLQANGYEYSTIYLGGLVGRNNGSVRNSAVEGADISADSSMSHAYAGGFVGRNDGGGIMERCYAVGRVSVSRARYGTVCAAGFAGHNQGTLAYSYAAAYLTAEGEAESFGFCPDSTTGCVYLNAGNFTYRGDNYAAQYSDDYAVPVTWAALAGEAGENPTEELNQQVAAVNALGMGRGAAVYGSGETYPYPAVVTDRADGLIHYGQWPEQMELGTLGVYYWEKLTIGEVGSYHISAVYLGDGGQITKSGTLSTVHGDGGVVTEYGYGYFHLAESPKPVLVSKGIGFSTWTGAGQTTDVPFDQDGAEENDSADEALSALMSGRYEFHSYNTWGTDEANSNQGLFVIQSGQAQEGEPPYGTWTLEGTELVVRLNPFFADALAVPEEWQTEDETLTALPGTAGNPYEVRSIGQLQFINWNSNARITNRPIDEGNKGRYPYLSYGNNGIPYARNFYWEQTHDLDGSDVKDYAPIAGLSDSTNQAEGNAYAWFSGSYNGNDYTIQQLSITNAGVYNTTGLFGFTRDAELKNIILYSPDGTAEIIAHNSKANDPTWYAVGGLVGLAANTQDSTGTISNCAVAGYTIRDENETCAYGGGGVGGLVGICNMALENCAAVTDIVLNFTHSDSARNVRVGGLAGSCQQSLTNCYSGGTISAGEAMEKRASNIHMGGLVGGYYMKVLYMPDGKDIQAGLVSNQVPTGKEPQISNCYTYVSMDTTNMPDGSATALYYNGNPWSQGKTDTRVFAIGGLGEIARYRDNNVGPVSYLARYENCWYLADQPDLRALDRDADGVSNCTYASLAGEGTADVVKAADALKAAGFSSVTTTSASGNPLSGRYSFGCDPGLLGRDYPFPTILTQSSDVAAGRKADVHYGDWPLAGIRREYGALPVNLDLFAYDWALQASADVHTETLTLEGVSGGGSWQVKSDDESIAEPQLSGGGDSRTLTITAFKAGSTVVTVTYVTLSGSEYSLKIEVNVTAELRLSAVAGSPVTVFTNETVRTPLQLLDRNNQPLREGLDLDLDNFQVEIDPDYFSQAAVETEGDLALTADSLSVEGVTQVTVGYDFTYNGTEYPTTGVVTLQTVTPEITLKPLIFTFPAEGGEQSQTRDYQGKEEGEFTLIVNEQPVSILNLRIVNCKFDTTFDQIILAEMVDNADGEESGTLRITAYSQKVYPINAAVQVQFAFEYAGSTHTLWKELTVEVRNETGESTEEVGP